MSSTRKRLSARVTRLRQEHPKLEHVVSTVRHYGAVDGNAQAGAVTFFGFLSFFPILALGFFVVGVLAHVYPELRTEIRAEVTNLLPGVIGNGEGEIRMRTFEDSAGTAGAVGLAGVLYSGLGWLSGIRTALETLFVTPRRDQPGLVAGKLRDLGALLAIGATLVVSVALSGLVSGFSERLLVWFGFDPESLVPNAALWVVAHGLAVGASTVLLLTMFTLLAHPHVPRRSLVEGALVGAVGFEVLKALAGFLIAQTKGQPAFQAFGVALILVVWINYFSRLVLHAAAYAYTSPAAVALRAQESLRAPAAALAGQGTDMVEKTARDASDQTGVRDRARGATSGPAFGPLVAAVAMVGAVVVRARRRGKMGR